MSPSFWMLRESPRRVLPAIDLFKHPSCDFLYGVEVESVSVSDWMRW